MLDETGPETAARPNLYGWDLRNLGDVLIHHGARAFHARQVYRWLYAKRVLDPQHWSDLPLGLRTILASSYRFDAGAIAHRALADDGTVKFRIGLPDGRQVEAVRMLQSGRITLCLSSQVGCALKCDFCLTGRMGLTRHLTAGEIVGQVSLIRSEPDWTDQAFNVVFMGMGEPLHNYDGTLAAVRLLVDPEAFGVAARRITISTAGVAPAIERLAGESVHPRLAVSLNATTDPLRDRLMPINRRYPLARLLEACASYATARGESFTFEYVLLDRVNDSDDDVSRLARIVRRHDAKLNLIPFNAVPEWLDYRPTPRPRVQQIRDRLLAEGLRASIRWSRGASAGAACGQLALLADRTAPPGATGAVPNAIEEAS
jgi:23S rRNA (adenine2503-C2)-methyltransferase